MSEAAVRRIVLVGFMGAGKTSVGEALAERLGWRFMDLDDEIVRRSNRSIEVWFAESGEAAFRLAEAEIAEELLQEQCVVVASGGGWAAQPGRLSELGSDTVSVWLDVDAEEALRRVEDDVSVRPLLSGDDAPQRARQLLDERRSSYGLAEVRVDTNGHSVEDVTSRILEILETREREQKPNE